MTEKDDEKTYLARSRSCAGGRSRCAITWRTVRSSGDAVMAVLLWPVLWIARRLMTLVVVHVVRLRRVRRVRRVRRARGRDVWIYRYFRVRLCVV